MALFGLSGNPPTGQGGHRGIVKFVAYLGDTNRDGTFGQSQVIFLIILLLLSPPLLGVSFGENS